ncbi:protein tramtrack, beta isoform-like isoform X2 [Macrobrachium nipponense]|uniref:protein tramtrack, beta isoform-like isoform X2 n=1 Tax=Macrobrachium nipponense TaxID=159736 RepID=UPI0030C8505C
MADILNVEWNNHVPTFFHMLSVLRTMEKYTDATLTCDGRFYGVHKLVLASCSDYFMNIFEKTPCKHPVIVLKDIKANEMEALLNYMYNGVVSVAQRDLSKFVAAAELLQIKGLAAPDEPPTAKGRAGLSLLPVCNTSVPVRTNVETEVHPPDTTQNATRNPTPEKRTEKGNEDDVIVISDVEEVAQQEDRNSCHSHVKVLCNQHVEEEDEEIDVVRIVEDDPQTSDGNLTQRRNSSGKENVDEARLSDGDDDAMSEQQLRPEMVAKKKSDNNLSPNKKTPGKSRKWDWSKCCLCQGDGGYLQQSVKGLRHLATQLPLFHALGETSPLPVEDFKELCLHNISHIQDWDGLHKHAITVLNHHNA